MSQPDVFSVHVSRDKKRKYSMMRFNVPVDLSEWNKKDIEIERDMSKKRNYDLRCVTTYVAKMLNRGKLPSDLFSRITC